MDSQAPLPEPSVPAAASPSPAGHGSHSSTPSLAASLWRRRGLLLYLLVFAIALMLWWPMLKGLYYRNSGAIVTADGIAWRTNLDAALYESKQTGKPVLIDFTASWCPPCQVMKHEVWPDARVRDAVNASFIPVMADVDATEGSDAASRYAVSTIPTILVTDAEGQARHGTAFVDAGAMLKFLKKASSPD
jgi:thiol:disulfide interchange protein